MQKEIAQSVQIPLRTYQRYENGERESNASAIIALANYFEVSTDYLKEYPIVFNFQFAIQPEVVV